MNNLRSCISPKGVFVYGIHKPSYSVTNLRPNENIRYLGSFQDGTPLANTINYPKGNLKVEHADWIFEIPNPFTFRGTTYIDKEWADASAKNYSKICLPKKEQISFTQFMSETKTPPNLLEELPRPLKLTLATCSTDPKDLVRLAKISCEFDIDESGDVRGLLYEIRPNSMTKACIHDHDLFEAVANNPHLPDFYKIHMVIRPGAQGASEIVGEWPEDKDTHIFEYLRRNSYIAGGHYAANMADDAIRYSMQDLTQKDITGLRHLYYQRTYIRLAEYLKLDLPPTRRLLPTVELEELRKEIAQRFNQEDREQLATLWGWNFGFDYAPSGYRLHASHQQVHQQYAMIPESVEMFSGDPHLPVANMPSYSCGDMVADTIEEYGKVYQSDFFEDYLRAIYNNKRMDDRSDLESDLIIWQNAHVILFVPKAQTSQWELQLMTKPDGKGHTPGNILETDTSCRASLDEGMLKAQKVLAGRGAKMVTSIEYSKRIGKKGPYQQPLLYAFLPKLPQSPGAFSEGQLRFINGHYPEDFAAVCRQQL